MENKDLIAIELCCTHYGIEVSFIRSLSSSGLIELVYLENNEYLQRDHISNLEKMIRLHEELNVNMEGIEVIVHLLNRVENLQEELRLLRNRLGIYE